METKYFGKVEHTPKSPDELMDIFNTALTPDISGGRVQSGPSSRKLLKSQNGLLMADLTKSETVQAARQARLDKLKGGKEIHGEYLEEYLEEILKEHYRSLEMTQFAIRTLEQKIKAKRKESQT